MKLNKAEKFVQRQFKLGKTRNGVREAIFEKLNTWNFPPEYENALVEFDPNYDFEPILGVDYHDYHDNYRCPDCGGRSETCFCDDVIKLPREEDENDDAFDRMVLDEVFDGIGHSAEDAVFGNKATQHEPCVFCRDNPCGCAVIRLPKLPEPGTQKWEDMVDFMRADLDNNMGYNKIINTARKVIEGRGLNFEEEFAKWKEGGKTNV